MIETNKIYTGDCREVMATFPDNCIQTCITSPPYYSLRDYEIEAVVWDGDPECDHEWGEERISKIKDSNWKSLKWTTGGDPAAKIKGIYPSHGQFCLKCGAWLGCLGHEPTPETYIDHLIQVFSGVKRVLRDDGTCWINIGDSYKGGNNGDCPVVKPKDMYLIPFRLAIALQAAGWWMRSTIIWHKPTTMPSSATDRPTADFEYVFLLAKSGQYYYDGDAIREPQLMTRKPGKCHMPGRGVSIPGVKDWKGEERYYNPKGRNKRTVWAINPKPCPEAHFATYPPELVRPMILAGSPERCIVLDPFCGSGTTCAVAKEENRRWIGIEQNPEYVTMAEKRIAAAVYQPTFFS